MLVACTAQAETFNVPGRFGMTIDGYAPGSVVVVSPISVPYDGVAKTGWSYSADGRVSGQGWVQAISPKSVHTDAFGVLTLAGATVSGGDALRWNYGSPCAYRVWSGLTSVHGVWSQGVWPQAAITVKSPGITVIAEVDGAPAEAVVIDAMNVEVRGRFDGGRVRQMVDRAVCRITKNGTLSRFIAHVTGEGVGFRTDADSSAFVGSIFVETAIRDAGAAYIGRNVIGASVDGDLVLKKVGPLTAPVACLFIDDWASSCRANVRVSGGDYAVDIGGGSWNVVTAVSLGAELPYRIQDRTGWRQFVDYGVKAPQSPTGNRVEVGR